MSRARAELAGRPAAGATLATWLEFAERLYAQKKVALGQVAHSAHDEALYLLLRTLDLPLESEASVLDRHLSASERAAVEDVLYRRVMDRIPAAYLTHEAWLGDVRFYVDERVIIPRSYFLEIIPEQLDGWLSAPQDVARVADVCTGSGCLAILLANHFPKAQVDAIDLSPAALEVAQINVREHRLARRVALHQSDGFDSVPLAKYDVILSNPPYEPTLLVDRQAPEFAAEPRMAHDGGIDGLVIIRKLLQQARTRLKPRGVVILEVGGLRAAMNQEFAALEPNWLPTQDGADCVCVIQAERLLRR
jgi:ribosomal protein L3 glutamine methyltransferase